MTDEQLDEMFMDIREDYESQFIKHYFDKEYSKLTKDDKHEMNCFGAYGIAEWVIENVKGIKNEN